MEKRKGHKSRHSNICSYFVFFCLLDSVEVQHGVNIVLVATVANSDTCILLFSSSHTFWHRVLLPVACLLFNRLCTNFNHSMHIETLIELVRACVLDYRMCVF